jgi:hypothetical protein
MTPMHRLRSTLTAFGISTIIMLLTAAAVLADNLPPMPR